jgi:DNA-3-methyladenine glycosylase II
MKRSLPSLNRERFARGVTFLCERDPDLAQVVREFGPPPMWARKAGFPTLIHIILEQQVSLASARRAFERLLAAASPLTPRRFLKLDDAALLAIGFSRQKTQYVRNLARSIIAGRLKIDALGVMDDTAVRTELIKLKGIGAWTADIYLLMALRRPDVWPKGDLALAVAAQRVKRLSTRPREDELAALSEGWKPWRAVAARILWHYYLSHDGRQRSSRHDPR